MYGGNKIIPGPRVKFARDIQRSADGTARQRGWKVTISGELAAFSGSPKNDGTWWTGSGYPPAENPATNAIELRLRNLRNKMGALAALFEQEGLWFEVQPGDGSAPMKCQLRSSQLTYDQGLWVQVAPYTIEAEADKLFFGSTEIAYLGQANCVPEETWSVEPVDEAQRSYKLLHTVSATAKKRFNTNGTVLAKGWEVARDLVLGGTLSEGGASLLGFDQAFLTAAGVLDLSTFVPFNYVRTQQVDEAAGRFVVSESWLCIDPTVASPTGQTAGKALEDLTVESRYGNDSGYTTVTISGVVTGLEERHNTTRALVKTRWANAAERFAAITNSVAHALAEDHSGFDLNPDPISTTVTQNKITGVIQWSKSFDTRPASTSGYLSEDYEVSIENAADVFAEIGVIARPAGPILQPIGSKTRKAVTVSANIVVRAAFGETLPNMPSYNPLPQAMAVMGSPTQIFVASDRPVWNQRRGRYSRSTTYVYQ